MNRIRLEPLALLLTIICICMSVLSLLSFVSSAADLRLSRRYGETIKIRYELEEAGQRFLNEAGNMDAGIIEKEIEKDGYRLSIRISKEADTYEILDWKIIKIWNQDDGIEGLWKGE